MGLPNFLFVGQHPLHYPSSFLANLFQIPSTPPVLLVFSDPLLEIPLIYREQCHVSPLRSLSSGPPRLSSNLSDLTFRPHLPVYEGQSWDFSDRTDEVLESENDITTFLIVGVGKKLPDTYGSGSFCTGYNRRLTVDGTFRVVLGS